MINHIVPGCNHIEADWSNITKATVKPLSKADVISWCTRRRAVSVEWAAR